MKGADTPLSPAASFGQGNYVPVGAQTPMCFGKGAGKSGPYSGPPGLLGGAVELNADGLPMRPGKDSCLLYLNNGTCPNGSDCIFDHPKFHPKSQQAQQPQGGGEKKEEHTRAKPEPEEIILDAGKTGPLPVPTGEPGMEPTGDGGARREAPKDNEPVEYNDMGLPMRPGAQKCGHYMRSGNCNWGPTCRFDHPAGLAGILNMPGGIGAFPMTVGTAHTAENGGFARRPGKEQCPFYKRTNTCPFGPDCRFDHDLTGDPEKAVPVIEEPKKKEAGLGGVRSKRPVRPAFSGGKGGGQKGGGGGFGFGRPQF